MFAVSNIIFPENSRMHLKKMLLIGSVLYFTLAFFILYRLFVLNVLPIADRLISIMRYNSIIFNFSFNDDNYISENQNKIDILHYDMSFDLFPEGKYFNASVEITGVITDRTIDSIDLNFYDNFEIKSVFINGGVTHFENSDKRISIPFQKEFPDTFKLKIIYSGTPEMAGLEGFVFGERDGYSLIYTLNEPNFASSWFPCNDIPNDKSLIDMRITNDSSKISVSNGKLIEVLTMNNRRTYHWKTIYPVSTYLIALYSADYKTFSENYISDSHQDTMQIHYYVLPDKLEKSKIDFEDHLEILKVFSKLFGEYPFIEEKYAVAEFLWAWGAMENQTVTGVSSGLISGNKFFNDYLIHEAAHHWWGNAVGPASWKDIWLNEGFSSYSEALYFEEKNGKEALQSTMQSKYSKNFRGLLLDPGAKIFTNNVYDKGAWLLHMLRWEVGDTVFFRILKNYFNTFKYSNAATKNFIEIAQAESGKNLEKFFNQWLNYEGEIKVMYNTIVEQTSEGFNTKLVIIQEQVQPEYYSFPIEVLINSADGIQVKNIFYVDSKVSQLDIETGTEPAEIILDPDGWLLGTFRKENDSK